MGNEMNRLKKLRADILSIPDKRMRSDFVGTLQQYCDRIQKARSTLEIAVNGQSQVVSVFPESDLSDSIDKASKAISTARNLATKVDKDPKVISGKAVENSLANISSLADSSLNSLKIQWKKLVQGKIRAFKSLIGAAEEANIHGSIKLRMLLDSLEEKATTPPSSREQVKATKQQVEDLVNSIIDIGLEGEVGAFLISAANGLGDPRILFKPAVKEFVERHNLWGLLRVRLD